MRDIDREREEDERRRREGRPTIDEEIARKYDSERLARLVVESAGRGETLDLATRSEIERRLPGHDFSEVRVFRGTLAEEVTARYRADAVTIANTGMVLVRESSRSAPGTTSATALLAHELTHVAQARQAQGTPQMLFAREGDSEGDHEAEARAVESEVAHGHGRSEQARLGDEVRQAEAKRRVIVERVMELMATAQQYGRERRGG